MIKFKEKLVYYIALLITTKIWFLVSTAFLGGPDREGNFYFVFTNFYFVFTSLRSYNFISFSPTFRYLDFFFFVFYLFYKSLFPLHTFEYILFKMFTYLILFLSILWSKDRCGSGFHKFPHGSDPHGKLLFSPSLQACVM